MTRYLFIFTLNYAVELMITAAILGKHWGRVAAVVLVLNLVTHPIFWWLLPKVPGAYLINLLLAETLIAAMETGLGILLLGNNFKRSRIIGAVLSANLATFLMTFLV